MNAILVTRISQVVLVLSLAANLIAQGSKPSAKDSNWFEKIYIDAGSYMEGETAVSEFHFQNPRDEIQYIKELIPNCQCEKATVLVGGRRFTVEDEPVKGALFELLWVDGKETKKRVNKIPIEAGQSGVIRVQMDLRGARGSKEATVMVRTTDNRAPVSNLRTRARAMQFFTVLPREINLNKMTWEDKREFTCRISSSVQDDFEITGHDPLPANMAIEYEKEMRNGKAVWQLKGTYGPGADPRSGGGVIHLHTSLKEKKIEIRVVAFVQGPLQITPGTFIPFGLVRMGKGASKEILIESTNDFDLEFVEVKLSGLSMPEEFITVEQVKQGKALKLIIRISPDTPRQMIRGDIVVKLNHPAAEIQEFQFNGFVR